MCIRDRCDYIKGFPWHPHRGIETITYLIEGDIEHGDSLGNRGSILNGECQWMTAGSGIIHQEMPQASPRMLGAQIWLNLPKKDKMTEPRYGDIKQKDVPVVETEDAVIRIIAGQYLGTKGAFEGLYVPATYLDVALKPNCTWTLDIPENDTLFIYVIQGSLTTDHTPIQMKSAVLFNKGEQFELHTTTEEARVLLLYAPPLQEPIAWGGPIVMNTRQELQQAFQELNEGTFIK
jgi:redox-sensitive bicupin YhaK (pirin superfamily)